MDNVIKPYDLQVPNAHWPDDNEVDAWLDAMSAPVLNVLVGPSSCGKTSFVESYGVQSRGSKATVSRTSHSVTDSLSLDVNLLGRNWEAEEIFECTDREEAVVVDAENLSRAAREKILSKIPSNYWKVAIVWELSNDELVNRGCSKIEIEENKNLYERPDLEEGFDEVVYIYS